MREYQEGYDKQSIHLRGYIYDDKDLEICESIESSLELGDIFKHCAWYLRCSNYNLTLLKRSLVGFFADSNFPRRSQYLCSQTCGGLSSGLSSISSSPATTSKRAWEKKGARESTVVTYLRSPIPAVMPGKASWLKNDSNLLALKGSLVYITVCENYAKKSHFSPNLV